MKPYSENLRVRIVRAAEEGMSKSEAARLFGVGLSFVKRHARMSDRGAASLAPRKGGGRSLNADETTRRPLEENIMERPAATIRERCRFLESTMGKSLNLSTIKRLLKRTGFSQKRSAGFVFAPSTRTVWL